MAKNKTFKTDSVLVKKFQENNYGFTKIKNISDKNNYKYNRKESEPMMKF